LATGVTVAFVVEVLFVTSWSTTPLGGLTEAELEIEPVAVPATVPLTVIVTLAPGGRVGTMPLTVLALMLTVLGQMAPPLGAPQEADKPLIDEGTRSLKLAPSAMLGPVLAIVML
jgi:hypothetical protein